MQTFSESRYNRFWVRKFDHHPRRGHNTETRPGDISSHTTSKPAVQKMWKISFLQSWQCFLWTLVPFKNDSFMWGCAKQRPTSLGKTGTVLLDPSSSKTSGPTICKRFQILNPEIRSFSNGQWSDQIRLHLCMHSSIQKTYAKYRIATLATLIQETSCLSFVSMET